MSQYQERWYRNLTSSLTFRCEVAFRETDLFLNSDRPLKEPEVKEIIKKYYNQVADYCNAHSGFAVSLSPLEDDESAPEIIREMIAASRLSGIGPFSSVAGAIAQYVGRELFALSSHLIVENGGDLFLSLAKDIVMGLYLGKDFDPATLNLVVRPRPKAFGICSSSGKMGHSLSFGRADLVTVMADSAVLADTFATALANQLKSKADIEKVIDKAKAIPSIHGLVCACDGTLGIWGEFQIAE